LIQTETKKRLQTTALAVAIVAVFGGLYFATRPKAAPQPKVARSSVHVSREQYRARMSEWAAQMRAVHEPYEATSLNASLPAEARVGLPTSERVINLDFAHQSLTEFALGGADKNEREMRAKWLLKSAECMENMAKEADERALAPSAAPADAHARAEKILARHEFHKVHGPDIFERIATWVMQWLSRHTPSIGEHAPDGKQVGRFTTWFAIAMVLLVAVWIFIRIARNQEVLSVREPIPFAARATHGWRWHNDEARRLAAEGEYETALYNLFWCAALWLEQEGAWRADRTRTPREMLRLLPEGGARRRSFGAILRAFELSWYAKRPTAESDYAAAREELGRMGCR